MRVQERRKPQQTREVRRSVKWTCREIIPLGRKNGGLCGVEDRMYELGGRGRSSLLEVVERGFVIMGIEQLARLFKDPVWRHIHTRYGRDMYCGPDIAGTRVS